MRVHGLGHVVLKVRDLNQSVPFYRDVLGLKKVGQDGEKMVFFSFVDNHHDIALLRSSTCSKRFLGSCAASMGRGSWRPTSTSRPRCCAGLGGLGG